MKRGLLLLLSTGENQAVYNACGGYNSAILIFGETCARY